MILIQNPKILEYLDYIICKNKNVDTLILENILNDEIVEKIAKFYEHDSFILSNTCNENFIRKHLKNKYIQTILFNHNTSSSIINDIYKMNIKGKDHKVFLARNPNTSSNILEEIYNSSKDRMLMLSLCRNPNTPSYILEQIYNKNPRDWSICMNLANNPLLSNKLLEQLSNYSKNDIKYLVFVNPNISQKLYNKMKKNETFDSETLYKYRFKNDDYLISHSLKPLKFNEEEDVLKFILTNPDTPVNVFNELKNSMSSYIKYLAYQKKV